MLKQFPNVLLIRPTAHQPAVAPALINAYRAPKISSVQAMSALIQAHQCVPLIASCAIKVARLKTVKRPSIAAKKAKRVLSVKRHPREVAQKYAKPVPMRFSALKSCVQATVQQCAQLIAREKPVMKYGITAFLRIRSAHI